MSQIWPLIAIAGSWALYGFFASLLISKKVKYIRYTFFSAIIGSALGGYLANNVIQVPSNIWYLSEFIKFLFVLLCLNLFVTFVQKD
tara:strand:+ start:302 stop:562 length:261 start_codon:yes stop_codon:yes gene_type:complete